GDPVGFLISVVRGRKIMAGVDAGSRLRSWMYPTLAQRVSAAEILTRKVLADLRATEIDGQLDHSVRAQIVVATGIGASPGQALPMVLENGDPPGHPHGGSLHPAGGSLRQIAESHPGEVSGGASRYHDGAAVHDVGDDLRGEA